jgi:hypothetical protein
MTTNGKLKIAVEFEPDTNPISYNHLKKIKTRSRAGVIRRLVEIGLLFERGLLASSHSTRNMAQVSSTSKPGLATKEDLFDDDILSAFNMED